MFMCFETANQSSVLSEFDPATMGIF